MQTNPTPRVAAVDALRGFVIALMALDHTRDYFGTHARPTHLETTTTLLFLTRWITHFCAPTFVLLAGVSAFIQGTRMPSRAALSRHLVARGAWLVFLEVSIVRLGWDLRPLSPFVMLQVIWAMGVSMIVLGGLVWLPRSVIAAVGLLQILLHNTFDMVNSSASVWTLLHVQRGLHPTSSFTVFVAYPLVPWIGVMALGYAIGPWFLSPSALRSRLLIAGSIATLGFIALRALNLYGDPSAWSVQTSRVFTVLSFLNCTKYPPSLSFLLMTLGPSLLLLGWLEGYSGRFLGPFITLGRVPLFFYLIHLPVIQVSAGIVLLIRVGPHAFVHAISHGGVAFGLPGVYLAWLSILALLYPLCARYAVRKRTNPSAWMRWV